MWIYLILKVSGHRDRCSAQSFQSRDEIRGLGPLGNRQCRTLYTSISKAKLMVDLHIEISFQNHHKCNYSCGIIYLELVKLCFGACFKAKLDRLDSPA